MRRWSYVDQENDHGTGAELYGKGLIMLGMKPPDMPMKRTAVLTEKFDRALAYASALHRTQVKKGTTIPYVAHLLAVASLVLDHGGDEDQGIAGLLHDAVEDQGGEPTLRDIREKFGDRVGDIVVDCTDAWVQPKPPWRERKEAYLAALPKKASASLLVSLADKVHNSRAIAADYRTYGEAIWTRFNGGREGTIWYYRRLGEIFRDVYPGPLQDDLDRAVDSFPKA
ncbi:MAG: HD domain-containing protein [Hyphomonadaceae bacterium]|nr:HD domain-containing protein [Hyphomonadaceae bacterium]MBY0421979.1 HD domain-containing protein [Parvularculaceae bacterium]